KELGGDHHGPKNFRLCRNSDLPENTQEFRLWGEIGMSTPHKCTLQVLAVRNTAPSLHWFTKGNGECRSAWGANCRSGNDLVSCATDRFCRGRLRRRSCR